MSKPNPKINTVDEKYSETGGQESATTRRQQSTQDFPQQEGTDSGGRYTQAPPGSNNYKAPLVDELLQSSLGGSGLSNEGKNYMEQLLAGMPAYEVIVINTDAFEARLVRPKTNKEGIILIFEETCMNEDVPASFLYQQNPAIKQRIENIKKEAGGFTIVDGLLVKPEDYNRFPQMQSFIRNTMENHRAMKKDSDTGTNKTTIENLTGSEGETVIVVDCDHGKTMSLIDKLSPHTRHNRVDVGCTISVQSTKNRGPGFYGPQDRPLDDRPFLAIGGFVEICRVPRGQSAYSMQGQATTDFVYLPVLRITECHSRIFNDVMVPLALATAASSLIGYNGWTKQFGYAKGKANLGNVLIEGEKSTVWSAKNPQEQSEVMNQYYKMPPYLAVDFLDGRAMLPGLANMVRDQYGTEPLWKSPDGDNKIVRVNPEGVLGVMNKLLKRYDRQKQEMSLPKFSPDTIQTITPFEFPIVEGEVVWDGRQIDTRYVDYFNLAAKQPNPTGFRDLLDKPDMNRRIEIMRELVGNPRIYFSGKECVLNDFFIQAIMDSIRFSNLNLKITNAIDIGNPYLQNMMVANRDFLNFNLGVFGGQGPSVGRFSNPYSPY